jgi:hypothetical protein
LVETWHGNPALATLIITVGGMPKTKTPSSIKDERRYEDLRKQGDSKEKAARISNAAAAQGRSAMGRRGGRSGSYADWADAQRDAAKKQAQAESARAGAKAAEERQKHNQ